MDQKIRNIILTLNQIPVSGKNNLSKLLGCIQALEEVLQEVTEEE